MTWHSAIVVTMCVAAAPIASAAAQTARKSSGSFQIIQTYVNPRFGNRVVEISGTLSSDYVLKGHGPASGAFPAGPFNGLQLTTYNIVGAELDEPSDSFGFAVVRHYRGRLTGASLTVSGTSSELRGTCNTEYGTFIVKLDVIVTVDGVTREFHSPPPCTQPANAPQYENKQGVASFSVTAGAGASPVTPAPVAAPVAAASPAPTSMTPRTNLDDAADVIAEQIDSLNSTCVGKAVSLGDIRKFRAALTPKNLIVEDGTDASKTFFAGRPSANASTVADRADSWGAPQPNLMYFPFKLTPASTGTPLSATKRGTVWHEAVHQIEALHGDRQNPEFKTQIAYRERNTAYLDAIYAELQTLASAERAMKTRIEGATDAEWAASKAEALAGLDGMAERFRQLEAGVGTREARLEFGAGMKKDWAPNLKELQAWTGVKINWNDILNAYATGDCGKELQAFALGQRAAASAPLQFSVDPAVPASPAPVRSSSVSPRPSPMYVHPRAGFGMTPPAGWVIDDGVAGLEVRMTSARGPGTIEVASSAGARPDPARAAATWAAANVGIGKPYRVQTREDRLMIDGAPALAVIYSSGTAFRKTVYIADNDRLVTVTAVFPSEAFVAGEAAFDQLLRTFTFLRR